MKRIFFSFVGLCCLSKLGAADALQTDSEGYIRHWLTLKKRVNVMVFKITNEQNGWQGAMRLLDKSGAPLKDIKIKL